MDVNLIHYFYFSAALGLLLFLIHKKQPLCGLILLILSIFLPFKFDFALAPYNVIFFAIFFSFLLKVMLSNPDKIKGNFILFSFLPLISIMLLYLLRPNFFFKFKENPLVWIQAAGVYYITVNTVKNKNEMRCILYTMALALTFFSLCYIIECYIRGASAMSFFHQNFIATQLGLFLIIILGIIFGEINSYKRILFIFLAAISVLALFLTASRWGVFSSLLILTVVIFIFTETKGKRSRQFIILYICVFFLISCLYMYFVNYQRYAKLSLFNLYTLRVRIDLWSSALSLFKQHPFVGIGPGNFRYYTFYADTHNTILEILVSTGLAGLLSFAFLAWRLIRYWLKKLSLINSKYRYLFIAGGYCFVFFMLRTMLDYHLEASMGIQLGLLLGIIDVLPLKTHDNADILAD